MNFPDISPVAFSIFGFEIKWYAIAYIVGFIFADFYIRKILRKSENHNISYKQLEPLVSYMIIGVIVGGRLGYTIFYNFKYYFYNPVDILKVWQGGMSFHGGLLGSIVALYIWCKKYKQSFLYMADVLSLTAPVGLFLGRIANFINAELYGRETDAKIGMIFPNTDGIPRHPSQLYEAIGEGIILFLLVHFLRKKKAIKNRYGLEFSFFILGYGIVRVIVENFREPDVQLGFLFSDVTMGQLLSLPMIVGAIVAIYYLFKKPATESLFITSPLLESFGLQAKFFTRNGGISTGAYKSANCKFGCGDDDNNVKKNREILMSSFGVKASTNLVTVNQQHTNNVIVIDKKITNSSEYLNVVADGIITNQKHLAIGVITADCVPILIYDKASDYIGIIHCGWRGLHDNIIKNAIDKLVMVSGDKAAVNVAIGPCLKQKSYEIKPEFMNKIVAQNYSYKQFFKKKNSQIFFDITGFAVTKLKELNIKNIEVLDFNTFDDDFFSYRRSFLTGDYNKEPTNHGRQLSVIMKM